MIERHRTAAQHDTAAARMVHDEGGAILVLGIFMCTGLVGMLWYVAGIGDAIQYRERMQEASDAVAFSAAVLHARGMNLIVLLNLIMAVVLSIRVILRVLIAALLIVAALLAAIPFIGWGLSALALEGANALRSVEQATQNPIDQTLRALSKVQVGVQRVVPWASIAGAAQVGARYRPVASTYIAVGPHTLQHGLPVAEGSTDKLCEMAGGAAASLLTSLLPDAGPLEKGKRWFENAAKKIIRAGGAYFCGLGNAEPPDLSEHYTEAAETGCEEEINKLREERNAKEAAYRNVCQSHNAPCRGGLPPYDVLTEEEQAEIDLAKSDLDAAQARLDAFDHDDCVEEKSKQIEQDVMTNMSEAQSSSSDGMTPKKVHPDWHNGINHAQILGLITGNPDTLRVAPRALNVGAWDKVEFHVPETGQFALAQAEFFYDCSGSWTGDNCNGPNGDDSDAMWNLAWRARLRRYNRPFTADAALEALAGAEAFRMAVQSINVEPLSWGNAALIGELGDAVSNGELFIH